MRNDFVYKIWYIWLMVEALLLTKSKTMLFRRITLIMIHLVLLSNMKCYYRVNIPFRGRYTAQGKPSFVVYTIPLLQGIFLTIHKSIYRWAYAFKMRTLNWLLSTLVRLYAIGYVMVYQKQMISLPETRLSLTKLSDISCIY